MMDSHALLFLTLAAYSIGVYAAGCYKGYQVALKRSAEVFGELSRVMDEDSPGSGEHMVELLKNRLPLKGVR